VDHVGGVSTFDGDGGAKSCEGRRVQGDGKVGGLGWFGKFGKGEGNGLMDWGRLQGPQLITISRSASSNKADPYPAIFGVSVTGTP
jgi:hypothetical protein